MGCYDYITVEAPCPLCGKIHNEWQTKDVENCFFNYGPGSYVDERLRYITGLTDCTHRIVKCGNGYVTAVAWLTIRVYLDKKGCIPKENIKYKVFPEIKHSDSMGGYALEGQTPEEFNADMARREIAMKSKVGKVMDEMIQEGIWHDAYLKDPDVLVANQLYFDYGLASIYGFDAIEYELHRQQEAKRWNESEAIVDL